MQTSLLNFFFEFCLSFFFFFHKNPLSKYKNKYCAIRMFSKNVRKTKSNKLFIRDIQKIYLKTENKKKTHHENSTFLSLFA